MTTPNKQGGLTLVELIVVIAIIGVIISFGLVISMDSYRAYYFRSERSKIVSVLERARSRSLSNYFQVEHGVCFITSNYVIFRGRSTCTPGATTDELIPANTDIASKSNFSGTFPTIIFSQLTATTTGGTINITDGNRSAIINVNYEGKINW